MSTDDASARPDPHSLARPDQVRVTHVGLRLRVDLEDFPHLALWARPPAPFLCIEAWTGHGDPVGFAGELADKPSMRLLPPGATARHTARFSLERQG